MNRLGSSSPPRARFRNHLRGQMTTARQPCSKLGKGDVKGAEIESFFLFSMVYVLTCGVLNLLFNAVLSKEKLTVEVISMNFYTVRCRS